MPVRKTESWLPEGSAAADLGDASVSSDGRALLVSYFPQPLVAGFQNEYVLFVPDAGLAADADRYRWTFAENGDADPPRFTNAGEIFHSPVWTGNLTVEVAVLDAGGAELVFVRLAQDVVGRCEELEAAIEAAAERPGPGMSNPDVLRELVNQYSGYYQQLDPPDGADSAGLQSFVFMVATNGAMRHTRDARREHLIRLAGALNEATEDFSQLAVHGAGVCGIRPVLLAMVGLAGGHPLIPWAELPERGDQRALAEEKLCRQLGTLDEATRIDLFNIVRFPKSNINHCMRVLEALRARYFPGADFEQAMTGMEGIRAFWIMRHYSEGPLLHS